METLYVTDLDGTLLNQEEQVEEYSIEVIHKCMEQGVKFTFATARSLVSARVVTRGLNIDGPVIVYNGAFIMNATTGEKLYSQTFTEEEQEFIANLLTSRNISPIVYSFHNGVEKVSWCTAGENEGMKRYFSLRKGDKRLNPLTGEGEKRLYDGDVFYYTCIGEKEELQPIYDCLKDNEHYTCILQQELYREEYWCEIMPKKATKAQAIQQLKEMWKCDRIVSFGDAINDLPMFTISDECYAVENAVEELKVVATGVIAGNQEQGVAKWLAENVVTVKQP